MMNLQTSRVTLVFPMAGDDTQSGQYRPFMPIGDETFIEAALRPFLQWMNMVERVVFICTERQAVDFQVEPRLKELFPQLTCQLIRLKKATRGPAETLYHAVRQAEISGPAIICDCDHSIDVEPMFHMLRNEAADCILPVWDLRDEDLKAWSVAAVDDDNLVLGIAEKQLPDSAGEFLGVIGCYYFEDVVAALRPFDTAPCSYISELIRHLIVQGKIVKVVRIHKAEFFGDQKRLRKTLAARAVRSGTIFCDLDGCIVRHEDEPCYDKPLDVLPGAIKRLKAWQDVGFYICLTTARAAADESLLRQSLKAAGIPYDALISGLPSGSRYLINDRKPSTILMPQAQAFEVARDQGVEHLKLPQPQNRVVKRFKGGSFAETLLVEGDDGLFIRKRTSKDENLHRGYAKLKSQFRSLERFSKLAPSLVPSPLGEEDNSFEYYYDMEYLSGHRLLSQCSLEEREEGLRLLLRVFEHQIYSTSRSRNGAGPDWLIKHLGSKIYPKLEELQSNPRMYRLVVNKNLWIDGERYPGLKDLLSIASSSQNLHWLAPRCLSMVHGDLTFENVLYNRNDVRVIDMDGADYVDALELDLGKLFQSLYSRYEEWAHSPKVNLLKTVRDGQIVFQIETKEPEESIVGIMADFWSRILECPENQVIATGLFYMGLHLVRMVPFRLKVSEEQALYALASAIKWIGQALDYDR